jgi:EAL domain-containing protein (putative c-di-GMP-specific phosphodiesterase class I)
MSAMAARSMLDTLLTPGALTTLFQPIVEEVAGQRRVYGYECLTRGPAGTNFEAADVLFEYARRKGAEGIMDRACIVQALVTASTWPLRPSLALNVHASTLSRDTGFPRDLTAAARAYGFEPAQIVVEIVEHSPVLNHRDFITSLDSLRTAGFRIAVDDVGLGYSNFKMMIDCAPDYLKIEREFTQCAATDRRRCAVIESVLSFANRVGARVVAEGIEEEADRAFLVSLGIELLQGYFYARPMRDTDAARFTTAPD